MAMIFKPAEPINKRLLLAIAGPQASGKTTSALRIASGITQATGGKIGMIDTENRRALRYATDFKFNHMEFEPPFNPARYQEAIEASMKSGYGEGDVLIVDSMSHEHDGPGGILEMHENFLEKKAGDNWKEREKYKFTAWIKPKAERNRCIQMGLNQCHAHVILCFRAKEKVKMDKDDNNKTVVVNDGWQPIGGDEYFYEMDITMILPQGSFGKPDWNEKASRINEYGDGPLKQLLYNTQQITEDTGRGLAEWSKGGMKAPADDRPAYVQVAQNIVKAIRAAKNPGELEAVMTVDYKDDIEIVSIANAATFQWVKDQAEAKQKTFNQ